MTTDPCDGCERDVHIAGGIENLWDFGGGRGEGMTLELDDGSEHFLCFECIESLPESATLEDVTALEPRPDGERARGTVTDAVDDERRRAAEELEEAGSMAVPAGVTVGAIAGFAVGLAAGDVRIGTGLGASAGLLVGFLWPRFRS